MYDVIPGLCEVHQIANPLEILTPLLCSHKACVFLYNISYPSADYQLVYLTAETKHPCHIWRKDMLKITEVVTAAWSLNAFSSCCYRSIKYRFEK